MKIPMPTNLTRAEARLALELLELLIDALIEYHGAMQRAFDLRKRDDQRPF